MTKKQEINNNMKETVEVYLLYNEKNDTYHDPRKGRILKDLSTLSLSAFENTQEAMQALHNERVRDVRTFEDRIEKVRNERPNHPHADDWIGRYQRKLKSTKKVLSYKIVRFRYSLVDRGEMPEMMI